MGLKIERDKPTPTLALQAAAPELPEFVETPTATRILRGLTLTHQAHDLGLLRGRPGIGKTSALREYVRRHREEDEKDEKDKRAWLFTLTELTAGKGAIMDMFRSEFEIYEHAPYRFMKQLIERLSPTYYGPALLIFDEAQNMTRDAASIMRSLSDEAKMGVFLAGNEYVFANARGRRGGSKLREAPYWTGEMAHINSRIGVRRHILGPVVGDVEAYAQACGISLEDHGAISTLWEIAQKPGGMRNVEKTLRTALRMDDGWPFTEESIEAAWNELGMDRAGRLS